MFASDAALPGADYAADTTLNLPCHSLLSDDDVHRRLREHGDFETQKSDAIVAEKAAGRGRPRLGVLAREVTLLPRHWNWLAAQPGGASQTLRRLVDRAKEAAGEKTVQRAAQEACYRFMSALAGDFPHFEEAARALFANDLKRLAQIVDSWPEDVRDYALALADGAGLRPR